MRIPQYAELWCLSNFSFLRGASRPEELVERAHALGYAALALTDECSLAGVVRAHVAAKELGLKLLLGAQFEVQCDTPFTLVLIARNLEGYGNISEFITSLRRASAKGTYEHQMLYGVRPDEQSRLAKAGERMRVYIPYGGEWYGYMVRRMAEKPANMALFVKSMTSKS